MHASLEKKQFFAKAETIPRDTRWSFSAYRRPVILPTIQLQNKGITSSNGSAQLTHGGALSDCASLRSELSEWKGSLTPFIQCYGLKSTSPTCAGIAKRSSPGRSPKSDLMVLARSLSYSGIVMLMLRVRKR